MSTPSTTSTQPFLDSIEAAIVSAHGPHVRMNVDTDAMSAAVLNSPEMKSIRLALLNAIAMQRPRIISNRDTIEGMMRMNLLRWGVSELVVDWVLAALDEPIEEM